jgi:hypothetical protein
VGARESGEPTAGDFTPPIFFHSSCSCRKSELTNYLQYHSVLAPVMNEAENGSNTVPSEYLMRLSDARIKNSFIQPFSSFKVNKIS